MKELSVVIPVLNDAHALENLLEALHVSFGDIEMGDAEIIVVDGGSDDDGCAVAQRFGCQVVHSVASRGRQLQAGLSRAQTDWIWFLHADSVPDAQVVSWLIHNDSPHWGRFDVRFADAAPLLVLVATMMNWRSRLSGICTGDQGIFAHRSLLTAIGGVPQQALMEDIELSKRLKREMAPECPRIAITTSGRRWQQRGVIRTIISMWWFRLRYWWGVDPEALAARYYFRRES